MSGTSLHLPSALPGTRSDVPHDGAACLDLWPPSLVERCTADRAHDDNLAWFELVDIAGSTQRAHALFEDASQRRLLDEHFAAMLGGGR